jgi:hypothetical protein
VGKELLLGLEVRFGCDCDEMDDWVEKLEVIIELEGLVELCGSLPRSTVARLSVPPAGVGKGRPRVGEGDFDEGGTILCIPCVGKGLLDSEDALPADGLAKGKTGVFALAPGDG